MQYSIIPPPAHLAPYVQYLWTFETDQQTGPSLDIRTIVDDSSGILVQHHEGRSVVTKNGETIPTAFLYGQTTQPTRSRALGAFSAVGALFHPTGLKEISGIDASELTDRMVPMEEFGGRGIAEVLLEARDVNTRLAQLCGFLTRILARTQAADPFVMDCLDQVRQSRGLITVADLLKHYWVSERQLERRFLAHIGVSPRHYLKVIRFGEALRLLRQPKALKLSDIAYALRYADQSHFIRHTRQLTGMSPRQLRRRCTDPPANLCL
jgi:AraC-like DNA-binding protein